MKLYATITSDRGGRPAKKGGNEYIIVQIDRKGQSYLIKATDNTIEIIRHNLKTGIQKVYEEKGKTDKR